MRNVQTRRISCQIIVTRGTGPRNGHVRQGKTVSNKVYLTRKREKQGVTGKGEIGANSLLIKVKQKPEHYQNKRQTKNPRLK